MIDYKFYKVFSTFIAKKLLQKGYILKDIERNTENPDKVVFVFKVDGDFMEDVNDFKEEIRYSRRFENAQTRM